MGAGGAGGPASEEIPGSPPPTPGNSPALVVAAAFAEDPPSRRPEPSPRAEPSRRHRCRRRRSSSVGPSPRRTRLTAAATTATAARKKNAPPPATGAAAEARAREARAYPAIPPGRGDRAGRRGGRTGRRRRRRRPRRVGGRGGRGAGGRGERRVATAATAGVGWRAAAGGGCPPRGVVGIVGRGGAPSDGGIRRIRRVIRRPHRRRAFGDHFPLFGSTSRGPDSRPDRRDHRRRDVSSGVARGDDGHEAQRERRRAAPHAVCNLLWRPANSIPGTDEGTNTTSEFRRAARSDQRGAGSASACPRKEGWCPPALGHNPPRGLRSVGRTSRAPIRPRNHGGRSRAYRLAVLARR